MSVAFFATKLYFIVLLSKSETPPLPLPIATGTKQTDLSERNHDSDIARIIVLSFMRISWNSSKQFNRLLAFNVPTVMYILSVNIGLSALLFEILPRPEKYPLIPEFPLPLVELLDSPCCLLPLYENPLFNTLASSPGKIFYLLFIWRLGSRTAWESTL
eukprot:IDg20832t1